MMMDEEIYGMMPSAKMVKRESAPPENMLNSPRIPPCWLWKSLDSSLGSMPGTGMCAPMRKTTKAPSKKNSLFFRSPYFPDLPICDAAVAIDEPQDLNDQDLAF